MNEDFEILTLEIGGIKIRDMSALTFYQYIAKKLNNTKTYNATVVELTNLVMQAPMSRVLLEDEKIRIIKKLKSLNIEL